MTTQVEAPGANAPPRRQHQPTAPNNRKPSPMNLPHPFDWPVDLAIWTALRLADLAVHLDGEPPVLGVGRGVDQYGRLEVATPGGLRVFAVGDIVHARLHS